MSQKFKLIGRSKFNHLINTLTPPSCVGSDFLLIVETQHVEYIIEIGGGVKVLTQDL
jgi:hypothetical protein